MSPPGHRIRHTYDEYLSLESLSNTRHEFLDGQIYAMSGGTPEHAALIGAMIRALQLPAGCRAYPSDLRVRTRSGLTTYPDITVVCGPTERDTEDRNAVTNPLLIVEVLSRATEQYDRGDKFEHYKSLPSLRQVVFVGQRERAVEVWSRGESGWSRVVAGEGEIAELSSIGARLNVREVYAAARL
ncbi:MAG TPA: Uma2 family endonuclease [Thermoanaerobaculia bacterium]